METTVGARRPFREHRPLDGVTGYPDELAERYRARGWWSGELLGDLVHDTAGRNPGGEALVGGGRRWTYSEAASAIDRLAGEFAALGIGPDQRVVVHLPSAPAFVLTIFALWRLGALPVFSLPGHGSSEIAGFVVGSGAVAVVSGNGAGGHDHVATVRAALGVVGEPAVQLIEVTVDGRCTDRVDVGTDVDTDADRDAGAGEPRGLWSAAFRANPRDVAFLQLSGGTTGANKLIPRSHDDYLYSVRGSVEICEVDSETVMLVALPVAHNFPMSSPGILGVLWAGGTCVFPDDSTPATAFEAIRRESVTTTALVPSLLLSWLGSRHLAGAELGTLQTVLVGGAPLDRGTAMRVASDLGSRLQQVFGMAEGLVCYTRLDDPEEVVLGTQGRPISPDDEIRIVDDRGREVADGEVGHLLTRGPYTIRGYYKPDSRASASFDALGYYRSGDLVRRDERGNLCVAGRDKDLVNRAGEKIHPAEVEGHLRACGGVADAAVVGVADDELGERLEATVVPSDPNVPPRPVALRRELRERGLARFKIPDRIGVSEELPRTAVGKTAARALREAGDHS